MAGTFCLCNIIQLGMIIAVMVIGNNINELTSVNLGAITQVVDEWNNYPLLDINVYDANSYSGCPLNSEESLFTRTWGGT